MYIYNMGEVRGLSMVCEGLQVKKIGETIGELCGRVIFWGVCAVMEKPWKKTSSRRYHHGVLPTSSLEI